jgi:ribosome-binding factor A
MSANLISRLSFLGCCFAARQPLYNLYATSIYELGYTYRGFTSKPPQHIPHDSADDDSDTTAPHEWHIPRTKAQHKCQSLLHPTSPITVSLPKFLPNTKYNLSFFYTVARRVQDALSSVLYRNDEYRRLFVDQLGFTIKDVHVTPDRQNAFILWDSYNHNEIQTNLELKQRLPKLKAILAKELQAKKMPRLEFKLDRPSAKLKTLDALFDKIANERED